VDSGCDDLEVDGCSSDGNCETDSSCKATVSLKIPSMYK
jgi:hypothetical protein